MKKTLFRFSAIIMCLSMLFALSSCGGNNSNTVSTTRRPGIYFDLVKSEDTKGVLKMKTNLSSGVKLSVLIFNESIGFSKDMEAEVTAQGAQTYVITEAFTKDDGSAIPDGNYTMKIQSKRPSEQSEEVQKAIGNKGQKLVAAGNNVYNDDGEYIVRVIRTLTVKDGVFCEKDK